jgi:tyrosyl-tRNA synthetase
MPEQNNKLIQELKWRGLLFQQTEGLAAALDRGPVSAYCGFDPTAPSLHVGNLVPVMGLVHLQRAGHRPIALVGGGTGMIGDPSGKASERQLSTPETVRENTRAIRAQLEMFLEFDGSSAARMLDNAEWLLQLGAVDFMRDVGKHFSVNYMLAKDSVQSRLDTGISYTEFSYMLLQAYDFLELSRRHGVTVQIGGSDQWGNITAGTELIRRSGGGEGHGFTLPLVTTSSGAKFGKSEAGAVWLDPARTSPYRFYQFWINADDRDVGKYLRYFTLLPQAEIEALEEAVVTDPAKREAQGRLAAEVTTRVHGADAARAAQEVSTVLFGKGDPRALSRSALETLSEEVPHVVLSPEGELDTKQLLDAVTGESSAPLLKSRGEARRMLEQGGLYLNGQRLGAEHRVIGADDMLAGEYCLIRKGAREYAVVRVTR